MPRSIRGIEDECMEWPGTIADTGYGLIFIGGRKFYAHRVVYWSVVGPIPKGLTIDHLCMNKRCVNPLHLEPVTQAENVRRAVAAGLHPSAYRDGLCNQGHVLAEVGRYEIGNGGVECAECARLRARAKHADGPGRGFGKANLCRKGHDMTFPGAVYTDRDGHRRCRECRLASNRRTANIGA